MEKTDYSQWQRRNAAKKPALFRVLLPPITSGAAKKEDIKPSPFKPKDEPSGKKYTSASCRKNALSRREKTGRQKTLGSETILAKRMANIRILQRLSGAQRNSLEELKRHSHSLLEKNKRLVEDILEQESEAFCCASDLLEQYEICEETIETLQDPRQNPVGVAKAELQEAEKMVEKNMGRLEQELSCLSAKVGTLQDELSVLRSYKEKEYPVRSIQITKLLCDIQNLRKEQQDELKEVEETARQLLEKIAEKAKEEMDHIVEAALEETVSESQDGLQQMAKNNQELRRQIQTQKEMIAEMEKEIEELQKGIAWLHEFVRHPQSVVFADILHQRPKCTPDMDVVLNIPTEEDPPL